MLQTDRARCHRRDWLQIGGLSLGALSSGLAPSLNRLLAAEQAGVPALDPNFSVILLWANGGPSHLDLFDLKPEAPSEIRGPFQPIATSTPGMEITELLPQLAQRGQHFTLLRNLHHNRAEHSGGTHRFLTGYSSRAANLPNSENPEIGSVVARMLEHDVRDMPLFVGDTQFYGGGPAYLGTACAPFMPHAQNAISASGNNIYDPIPIFSESRDDIGILSVAEDQMTRLQQRAHLVRYFDSLERQVDQNRAVSGLQTLYGRAVDMLVSPRLRDAFDLSREAEDTRRRYGATHFGKSLLTCRRLVEAGARFVQCQASYRLKPETGRTSNWDDHSVNSDIFKAYEEKLPSLDQAMSALIDDLDSRGLSNHVLFLFCGEFGRTPRIAYQDVSKRPGRDHWPAAMSVLAAGGGLRMGQVIGATNARGEYPVERAMDSNCLLATIYHKFGIDPQHEFQDALGRPLKVLPDGHPIPELLG